MGGDVHQVAEDTNFLLEKAERTSDEAVRVVYSTTHMSTHTLYSLTHRMSYVRTKQFIGTGHGGL